MRITCPSCHSEATLHPNPAQDEEGSLPRYLFACSGCARTSIRRDDPDRLLEAPGTPVCRVDNAYTALRGWVVTNGEIRALIGQQGWEASTRGSEPRGRSNR